MFSSSSSQSSSLSSSSSSRPASISSVSSTSSVQERVDIVPAMTSNNTPAPFVVSASVTWGANHARFAFSDTTGTPWVTQFMPGTTWIKVDLGNGNAKAVDAYRMFDNEMFDGDISRPNGWTLQGSNNDSVWIDLDTRYLQDISTPGGNFYTFENITPYRYYRFNFIDLFYYDSQFITVDEIELYEYFPMSSESSESFSSGLGLSNSSSSESFSSGNPGTSSQSTSSVWTFEFSEASINQSVEKTSSLNSSSSSSSSSPGSEPKWHLEFPFRVFADRETPVWCFERVGEYIYAGTGPDGIVLRSKDLTHWDEWKTVEDSHIKCMAFYANGLWMGTEPNGNLYVYNFTTNTLYPYLKTPDHAVSSMAVFQNKLYIGTSPGGNIYTFDGSSYTHLREVYGRGITSMFSTPQKLYISVKSAESLIEYDGNSWKFSTIANPDFNSQGIPTDLILNIETNGESIEKGSANPTIASSRHNVSTEPFSRDYLKFINRTKISDIRLAAEQGLISDYEIDEIIPPRPECNLNSINKFDEKIITGGSRGILFSYETGQENKLTTIHNNADTPIVSISSDGFFCTENKLYFLSKEESV